MKTKEGQLVSFSWEKGERTIARSKHNVIDLYVGYNLCNYYAQYSLHSAELWPKTPNIHSFILCFMNIATLVNLLNISIEGRMSSTT